MIAKLWKIYGVSFNSGANAMLVVLGKLPFIRNKFNEEYTWNKLGLGIVGAFVKFLISFIKRLCFVALFMMLPQMLFERFMPYGVDTFELTNCYVYFGNPGFPASTRERPRETFFSTSRGQIPLP